MILGGCLRCLPGSLVSTRGTLTTDLRAPNSDGTTKIKVDSRQDDREGPIVTPRMVVDSRWLHLGRATAVDQGVDKARGEVWLASVEWAREGVVGAGKVPDIMTVSCTSEILFQLTGGG